MTAYELPSRKSLPAAARGGAIKRSGADARWRRLLVLSSIAMLSAVMWWVAAKAMLQGAGWLVDRIRDLSPVHQLGGLVVVLVICSIVATKSDSTQRHRRQYDVR